MREGGTHQAILDAREGKSPSPPSLDVLNTWLKVRVRERRWSGEKDDITSTTPTEQPKTKGRKQVARETTYNLESLNLRLLRCPAFLKPCELPRFSS